MNERIQELEIETDAWCDANFPTNWTDRVDEFLPLWNKKFAELIIEECCDVVRYIDAVDIKKHFGVKE
jgi:hypothetical protein